MKIFVINLKKDQARRESIQTQMDDLKLPFEFFLGVLGRDIPTDTLQECYSEAGAFKIQCRKLTASEIGCALSHIGVYREIVRRKLPWAMVLEDDVDVSKLRSEILAVVEKTIDATDPAVVLLSPAQTRGAAKELGLDGLRISPFKKGYYAHAYFVNQYGARSLLLTLYPVKDYADCWQRLQRHRVVDIFAITPALVLQNQAAFGSSTTEDIQAQLKGGHWGTKMVFKARRAFWLAVDSIWAIYDRHFNPYAGVLKSLSDKEGGN